MVAAANVAAAAEVDGSQSLPAPATATVPSKPVTAGAPTKPPSRFRDTEDGQLDLSYFLASPRAFLPIPLIITEPAVGYGLASRWLDGRLRSLAGAGVGKINLDFYGRNGAPADTPVGYTLDLAGGMVQADWTLAPKSPWSVGLRYAFADVQP